MSERTCNSLPSRCEISLLCTSPSVCNSKGVFPNVFDVKFNDFTFIYERLSAFNIRVAPVSATAVESTERAASS